MKGLFNIDNIISTNERNAFKILAVNKDSICVECLLSGDFRVFTKTEHTFKFFDKKIVLKNVLKEISGEIDISQKDKEHLLTTFNIYIDKLSSL